MEKRPSTARTKTGTYLDLLKQTYKEFVSDDAFGKAASVAYYAVFSLPGLFLIIIAVSTAFFDEEVIIEKISDEMAKILGSGAVENFAEMMRTIRKTDDSMATAIIGILSLVFGATGLFIQLQNTLNSIWEVRKKSNAGLKRLLKDRALSFGFIVVINFLLLLSLVVSAVLSGLNEWISYYFSEQWLWISRIINFAISLSLITFLFATIFKFLPDVEISWPMVWSGAFITAVLFTAGKELIAWYITVADPGSSFGAGSSIILFLVWIFYSCIIVFFGAEFTQVFARRKGYRIVPSDHAEAYGAEFERRS